MEAAQGSKPPNFQQDLSIVLTSFERRRIRRAIYRWQIYCNIFTGHKEGQGSYSVEDRNTNFGRPDDATLLLGTKQLRDLYFAYLYPWEVEEMVVIYEYAIARYAKIMTSSDDINLHAPRMWTEVFIARGPDLLCQSLTQLQSNEPLHVLSELVSEHSDGFFAQSMGCMKRVSSRLNARHSASFISRWKIRTRLYFEGDNVAEGPNAGWVIAHHGEFEAR